MATQYNLSKKLGRGPTALKKFEAIRDCLGFQQYPSGACGWSDRKHWVFETAGYRLVRRGAGMPDVEASALFYAPKVTEHIGVMAARILKANETAQNKLNAQEVNQFQRLIWTDAKATGESA